MSTSKVATDGFFCCSWSAAAVSSFAVGYVLPPIVCDIASLMASATISLQQTLMSRYLSKEWGVCAKTPVTSYAFL